MTATAGQPDVDKTAGEVAAFAKDAVAADRPLFLIIHYEHEAIKIAFLGKLRKTLQQQGITPQTFDPGQRPDQGTGHLYSLLAPVAKNRGIALITGLPRLPNKAELDPVFLEYFNLHRDLIPREHLRIILLLHTADAAPFITSAGDLWDFRHHTFWLEGGPSPERTSLWELPERADRLSNLPVEEQDAVNNHLESIHSLIQRTDGPEDKAALFLDLSRWLSQRYHHALAAEAALEGLNLLSDAPTSLRGALEFALGYALREDNHLAEALAHYRQALAITREIGNRASEGTTLNNIAQIYHDWCRYDEALKTLEESLSISREIGNRAGEGVTLNNISQIYKAWGHYDEALKALEESLAIRREIGDRAGEGATLNNISQIYDVQGNYDEALKTLQESLTICREIGDRAGEGVTLNNISHIYMAWGRYDEALKTLEESFVIRREIGDRAGEGIALNNISHIYYVWGRYDEALKALEESLAIRREIGDRAGEGVTCWNLAQEYQRRGDLPKALEFARCTVAIEEETRHPDLEEDRAFLRKLEQDFAQEKPA